MLVIRDAQLAVFERAFESAFVERVVDHLRRALPAFSGDDPNNALREAVLMWVRRAGEYGIVTEYDLVRFVDLQFVIGADFDTRRDWAREILADVRLLPSARLDLIEEHEHLNEPPVNDSLEQPDAQ